MVFHHVKKSHHQLLILHGNDIIQIFAYIGKNLFTRSFHRRAVRNGIDMLHRLYLAGPDGSLHTGRARRLHADDFDLRIQKLGQRGYACGQSAAADGHQNIIHKRQFLYNLHSDGSLSRSHGQIVKGMHKGVTVFRRQLLRMGTGLIVYVAM